MLLTTDEEEWSTRVEASIDEVLKLQRPLLDAMMKAVATGWSKDEA